MKSRLLPGILMLALAAGCAARTAPPPPPTAGSDAVRIARIVRLMELNRHRVDLELERISMSQRYGERHPDMLRVTSQLAAVDAAIKREFLPDEQAAIAAYDDKATALRLQLQQELTMGRGENHPQVVSIRNQIATLETMAKEARGPQTEAALLARIQQEPRAPAPQIELALHYVRLGRDADAARALERAMQLLRRTR